MFRSGKRKLKLFCTELGAEQNVCSNELRKRLIWCINKDKMSTTNWYYIRKESSYAQAFQVKREKFDENPSELHTIINQFKRYVSRAEF